LKIIFIGSIKAFCFFMKREWEILFILRGAAPKWECIIAVFFGGIYGGIGPSLGISFTYLDYGSCIAL
jgi:hypothetical protein